MTDEPREPRLSPLPESEWTDETRQLLKGMGEKPLNIFSTLARHPKLLKRWLVFGAHILSKNSVPERERELLILRTGWRCKSEYEFHQHAAIARRCGISDEEIRRTTRDVSEWSGDDAVLIRAADELVEDRRIADATWEALSQRYSDQQLMDLIFTVGQYTLVSMALNSLGVQTEDGSRGFPQ
ncbi:MAG: carboxymuconolactone decarboxylase family protein [Myxococcales bacterium]